jgi:predicted permease
MALAHRLRRLASAVLGRSRREADLDEEIRFHIDGAIEGHLAAGIAPGEARRLAMLEFGGVDRAKEEVRDAWPFARFGEIARDTRLAIRGFRKRPAYAATVIVTLALAVGAAGTIFNALWAIVVRPLPFNEDRRLGVVEYTQRDQTGTIGLSPLEVADYRAGSRALGEIAEYHQMSFTLLGHGEPRRVSTGVVSTFYFSMLGVRPVMGRDFVEADDLPDARPVLLLSYRFWRNQLGGDPALLNADFTMNDRIHTVVGVLPPLPALPDEIDVYMPVHACPFRASPNWAENRSARGLIAIARLKDGFDPAAANADLETIVGRLAKSYPDAYPESAGLKPRLSPLRESLTQGARPTLYLLVAAAIAVLLLVTANLFNLTLAQVARREPELAMRTALGGSQARLARQLATEGCVLALAGGGLGLLLAVIWNGLLARFLVRLTPRATEIRLDPATIVLVAGLSIAVGLTIGLLPALRRRTNLVAALRSDGPNATSGGSRTRLRDALVVLQVAASFVLLIGAGLLLRSLWKLEQIAPGYSHAEVLTVSLPRNWSKYATTETQVGYARRILAAVHDLPGVEAAALADSYPLDVNLPYNRRVAVGKVAPNINEPGPTADFRTVSAEYFDTVGVPLLAGRALADGDDDAEHPVALVNQAFARKIFPDADPIGRQVTFARGTVSWTIVGVVADVRQRSLDQPPAPELYVPMTLNGGGQTLLLRANAARSLIPSLRDAIRRLDPGQPIVDFRTLAEARAESLAAPRATAALLAIAAVLALAIAAAGLAGLLAYTLGQRQREFGIRLALGATRGDIARLVLGRTGGLVGLGALIGIGGALVVARGLDSMLFGLSSSDPATYAAVAAVLLGSALVACLPALKRAVSTAPSLALRAM